MSTVLTVKELSQRWNIPTSTVYELIKAGKLPVLSICGAKRILISSVETLEQEAEFNPRQPKSILERKLEQELEEKEEEIKRLKGAIASIQSLTAGLMYKDFKEG